MLTIGSLFSGYGGLDLAVEQVTGAVPAWFCEHEAAPSKVLATHWPDVPNLGDITAVDWSQVQLVDIITGGFPCQDISAAGKQTGLIRYGGQNRSGLWAEMCRAIDILRPSLVVAENVRNLLNVKADSVVEPCAGCVGDPPADDVLRALGAVLGDLADIGYDARWCGLRAADVGAPHGRFRVFVVAHADEPGSQGAQPAPRRIVSDGGAPGDADVRDSDRRSTAGLAGQAGSTSGPAADAGGETSRERPGLRADEPGGQWWPRPDDGAVAAPDTPRDGRREGRSEPAGIVWGSDAAERGAVDWGQYAAAIRRWEHIVGQPAPAPTEPGPKGGQRLSARLVEWMMGLPAGWVTDVPDVSRNEQLKMLGNGVVPQQAAAALHHMLAEERAA